MSGTRPRAIPIGIMRQVIRKSSGLQFDVVSTS